MEALTMEYVLFWIGFAVVVAILASRRGRSGFGWFLLAIVLSPLLAGLLVLVLENLAGPITVRVIHDEATMPSRPSTIPASRPSESAASVAVSTTDKQCPQCAEMVKAAAKICRFCRHEFTPGEAQAAPSIKNESKRPIEDRDHMSSEAPTKACTSCSKEIAVNAHVCRWCGNRQKEDWPKPSWLRPTRDQ